MSADHLEAKEVRAPLSEDRIKLIELLRRKRLSRATKIEPTVRGRSGDEALLPISAAQQQLWLIDLEGGGQAYNVPISVRIRGSLDQRALQHALNTIVQRHEVLRTVFVNENGDPRQKVVTLLKWPLSVIDLSGCEEADREARVRSHSNQEARGLFDLSEGPLFRSRLLKLSDEEHVLLLTLHHIIFDAWSMRIFARELAELYGAHVEGRSDSLPPLPIQFGDFARWQREWLKGGVVDEQMRYWRAQLAGAASQLELPSDRPRPAIQSYRGDSVMLSLGADLSAQLKALAQRHGMTLFMISSAAYANLLSRLSGQEDVLIGTPVANRLQSELEGMIGFFVNTLVLRIGVRSDLRLGEFLEQVRKTTLEAYDHQDLPFETLVEALQPQRIPGRNPLFQAMLVVQTVEESDWQLPGLTVTSEGIASVAAKFDLQLSLEVRGEDIVCRASYAADLFNRETVERWVSCFAVLLKGMQASAQIRIGDLPILSDDQRQLIESFNATKTRSPRHELIHDLFEEQAQLTPDVIAVTHGQQSMTYAELNGRANQLARYLRERGTSPDMVVGICIERSPEMVVALLGIMKSGAAYLPLDPNYPRERLKHMLEDADPPLILTQEKLLAALPETRAQVIPVGQKLLELAGSDRANLCADDLSLTGENLVYVIYTSGSTGRPKGTAMPHRAMVNLVTWQHANLGSQEAQRVLQFAALSFDVAFQEIFTTLCTGGTLVLLDEWVRRDAAALTELLRNHAVQRLFVPPLMLQTLAECDQGARAFPTELRDVITAGEQLRISPEITDLFKRLRGCRLHNHYGPTETHVVTALTLAEDPDEWPVLPTIGRPIDNIQIHVLDERRRQVPLGVVGEIYIGGVGLARGYLGRPELSAQRFTPDTFSADPEARMYRTGDLGRWLCDGTIEYLGRNDDQVKIRGYRIELGEIESQLARHEKVKTAAVVAREDVSGEKRLVAYITQVDQSNTRIEELRAYLKGVLPDYMVPTAFVTLERLPLTPSGKLDRRALPAPDIEAYTSVRYEPPLGEVEEGVARIWQESLRLELIGRHDNVFELGAHSLLSVKALFRINQLFGVALKVKDLYKNPTVQLLAARICGGVTEDEPIDLAREATLDSDIVAMRGLPCDPASAVMLTGGTGFVGRFLLAQLLEHTEATVYCLVRASSNDDAFDRLRSVLLTWDLWNADFARRIVAIPGDLRLPRLGMDEADYQVVARSVDGIYHCATSMNHLETYAMAKRANVGAARELLQLATQERPKVVNYISTMGIFNPSPDDTRRVVDEQSSIDEEMHFESSGYVASKWVGEKIFMVANERGIPCNIFRVGLVWPDTQRGRYDELQHGYRILKSCLLSGYGIENYRSELPPTPVDYAARAIVFLAGRHSAGQGIFHISSPGRKIEDLFERCNEIAGTSLQLLPFYDWIREMKRLHLEGRSLPAIPLIEYAFSMDERSLHEQQQRKRSRSIKVDCARTYGELERAGIVAPVLDDDLLKVTVQSMLSRDAELRELYATAPKRDREPQ